MANDFHFLEPTASGPEVLASSSRRPRVADYSCSPNHAASVVVKGKKASHTAFLSQRFGTTTHVEFLLGASDHG